MQAQRISLSTPDVTSRRNLILIGALTFFSLMFAMRDQVSVDIATILAFGYIAVFTIAVIDSLTLVLPVPVIPVIILAGGILDPFAVGITAALGMTAGMSATYFAASSGKDSVRTSIENRTGFTGRLAQKVLGQFDRKPALTSFALAAIPSPVFAFSGMMAGAAGVPARTYFLYTFLGRIVITLSLALAGKYAASTIQSLGLVTG